MNQKRKNIVNKTHNRKGVLNFRNSHYRKQFDAYVLNAIKFDSKDITSRALHLSGKVSGAIICKDYGILAGIAEAKYLARENKCVLQSLKEDGELVSNGDVVGYLKGSTGDVLKLERTVLNLIQRMSGIATETNQFVKLVSGRVLVVATRKTLWGLLDKKACVVGGGGTHRLNLSDAILVKDTHMDLENGDLDEIFGRLARTKDKGRFIEVEVRSIREAIEAAQMYEKYLTKTKIPFYLMLDNMHPAQIGNAIRRIGNKIYFEASGGINKRNVVAYSKTGVDVVSIGRLTHSAQALDFSLKIK